MGKFVIDGGKSLFGEISVGGSKNAALPIIFSTITVHGISTVSNLPDIIDVDVALSIIRSFGAIVMRDGATAYIDTHNLKFSTPPECLISGIRASSYLIGACLSRFGVAELRRFGGCNFDLRPIDMHISAAEAFGATLDGDILSSPKLYGAEIHFKKISVGATVNAILMSVSAEGVSRIFGYAKEPHIISLIEFLISAGADITLTDGYIEVVGARLSSGEAVIPPDMIEAGTYLALSLMTDSKLRVLGAPKDQLASFIAPFTAAGTQELSDGKSLMLLGGLNKPISILTAPYPDFPTDLQPITAPLLARFCGGEIKEGVWHNRFGYLSELAKLGLKYKLHDGYATIESSTFTPAEVTAPDLRGGAALILAALTANGESIIHNTDLIKRGYGSIVEKLCTIGARIKEI